MSSISFATLRLGKTSVDDIKKIDSLAFGIPKTPYSISVVCTQVPSDADKGTYTFIWLGSDNSKGIQTSWKQGFRALGYITSIERGASYNDNSTILVDIVYIFSHSVSRVDILKLAPKYYYWCSNLPIIGIDDHSNQTVRMIEHEGDRVNINAFFMTLKSVLPGFEDDMRKINPDFEELFYFNDSVYTDIEDDKTYSKDELVDIMVSMYTDPNIPVTAAGGIFVFKYGKHVVDVYSPVDLINSAHAKNDIIKTRYSAELNAAFLMFKYFRTHPMVVPKAHRFDSIHQAKETADLYNNYLRALRTKPFMLLAGISGTGKSRIVRELAFKSCPEYMRDKDGTTPGNYLMIEVKPNWHDSTEILGYYSSIAKKYQYTKFIRFAVKATLHPEVPFFVCLDEMNLAPVEQYFAEFLSVLETRKKVGDKVNTGILVEAKYMKGLKEDWNDDEELKWDDDQPLTLPDNLFVIGTVNMDDTTHQFSRKVIDRAMTIEMNGGSLESMFENRNVLEYLSGEDIWKLDSFKPQYVTADEALAAHPAESETMKKELSRRLSEINDTLAGTPFQVSYRVLNELCIYAAVLLDDGLTCDEAISEAVDKITLMKILPRIEGDEDMFRLKGDSSNKLQKLRALFADTSDSWEKLGEMDERLNGGNGFTRFWP